MTAEWKKSAIERTKRKNDLAQAQAELKMLKESHAEAKQAAAYYRDQCAQVRKHLDAAYKEVSRYDLLRSKGVLIEIDGEFKFLQGADLDAFWEERDKRRGNSILNEAAMRQMMANTVSTPRSASYWLHDEKVVVYGINS